MSHSAEVMIFTGALGLTGDDPTRWLDDILPAGGLILRTNPVDPAPVEMIATPKPPAGPPVALVSCVIEDLAVLIFQADEQNARSAFAEFVLGNLPDGLQVVDSDAPDAVGLPDPATGQVTFYPVRRSFTNVAGKGEAPVTKGQPCIVISA